MSKTPSLLVVSVAIVLNGCAVDPMAKLDAASDLVKNEQPLLAEQSIIEGIAAYQERGDPHGLGHAYRTYGELLQSPAIGKKEAIYRRDGFGDKSVTLDNRFSKAREKFSRALEYYQRAAEEHRRTEQFDALTNVYYSMAWSYRRLGDRESACRYFDETIKAYRENTRRNPGASPIAAPGVGSVIEVVDSDRIRMDCR